MDMWKTILTAVTGSLGFSFLYGLRKSHLFFSSLGGLISWGVYLLVLPISPNQDVFFPCFVGTVVTALYVNIISRKVKAPTQLFLLPALLPLVPGSGLYYTFSYFYKKDWPNMWHYAATTCSFALAIAAGMSIVWLLKAVIQKRQAKATPEKTEPEKTTTAER